MKKILILSMIAMLGFGSCGVGSKKLSTDLDSLSYAFSALQVAPMVAAVDTLNDIDPEIVIQAIRDYVKKSPKMTQEEANAFVQNYFTVTLPAKGLKEAEEFLAETEKKSGVVKTESGLLYEIIEPGSEIKATNDADTVKVLYTGTLPNGTKFDSTADRGDEPAIFSLNRVIPAWTEGMKLIGAGGKVKLYVHPDLAYGPQGSGQQIGPNQALIFDVELIEVMPVAEVEAAE